MYRNDEFGCCTCVSIAHMLQVWTANQGKEVQITDQDVLNMYDKVNGGVDEGANMIDVLNLYRRKGFAGRRLGAYVGVTIQDQRETKEAIYLTGGIYVGVDLPLSAQDAKVWEVPKSRIRFRDRYLWEPGGWGGHAMGVVDYNKQGVIAITWGAEQLITWDWLTAYCAEAYALIAPEWVNKSRKAPNGIALTALLRDVQVATKEKIV
jgi:hypothetical protein